MPVPSDIPKSSARPDHLEHFTRRARTIARELQESAATLVSRYNDFLTTNQWGHFDAGSLLQGYRKYIHENEFDASWVATIAASFRRAGAGNRLATLPDSAIKASLRAAGLDRGRRSVTFDDPKAYGFPTTTGYTDDPVNTATGNFVVLENDLVCGGLADGLSLGRTYNSRSDRVGPFGRGWASWASARLVPGPDGAAYVGPDGQEALFARMGDGYGRVVGIEALVESLESGLALRWLDGRRWEFDEAGRPARISRGPGTDVRLEHDVRGLLVGLAHGGGKHVRVQWDDDGGRVVALECSDGRRVSYGYDASVQLVEVEGAGGTRRYDVDEHGRVASIVDADGVVEVVNSFDDEGRVLEQLSPFGRRTRLCYLPGRVTVTMDDDEDHPFNTYIHDAVGCLLAIIDGEDRRLSMGYDDRGNLVSLTERDGTVTVQEYDDRARPVRRVLPTGTELTFSHDGDDRVVEIALSSGAVTRFAYDGDERTPSEIVDHEGAVARLTVRDGIVSRFVDPDGIVLDFEFDADGNPVAATDAEGNRGRIERDAAGRVTAAVTPLGRRTEFEHDARGLLVSRRDPSGGVWHYEHTAAGRPVAITDPTGAREESRYGAHGEVVAFVDALGNASALEYDVFGNVVETTAPDGARWHYAYDALMRLTQSTDPAGGRWQREYDVNGTLVARSDPTGVRHSAIVDAFGRVTGVSDGLSSESMELDELGRTVALLAPDGGRTRIEYDGCNRRTLVEDASGAITRVQYTAGGRVARVVFPTGRADTFEYDACGRLFARVDGAGRRWEHGYDADGEIVETRLPTGEAERFAYDDHGRLTARTVPGEGTTTYAYDTVGRVTEVTDRAAGARRFGYDAAGRLVESTDANGAATHYDYDEGGRATRITDPLGGTITRRYDAAGRIAELTDQLGRTATIAYDGAGRTLAQSDASGRVLRCSYDLSGRIISFGPAGDAPVAIEYDALGMPVAVEEPGSFANRLAWDSEGRLVERIRGDLAMRWTYNPAGERATTGYPDGSQTSYTRDAGGYVIGAHHPALGEIELQRDGAGRLVGANAEGMRATWRYEDGDLAQYEIQAGETRRSAVLARDALGRIATATIDGQRNEFAYDDAGQLISAVGPGGARAFHYDANGRLVREQSPAGEVAYEYDAAGQLLARTVDGGDATRYEYDGAGRRVLESGRDLSRRYRWDALGRLTEIDDSGPDGDEVERVRVVVDALGELAELNGTPLMWDTADPFAPLAWTGGSAVVGEATPWALAAGGAAQWLAPDWQGTIGDLPRDPWGAVSGSRPGGAGPQLGYRGEVEFAGETWLRHRVYEPASRSFAQVDPLLPEPGMAAAGNPYNYAANNPIGMADPLGLRPVSENELNHLRNRMDRSFAQKVIDAQVDQFRIVGGFLYKHAGTISAITGVLALIPPLTTVMLPLSFAFGGLSMANSIAKKDYLGLAFDVVGLIPGVGGAMKGAKASRALRAAKADDALRRLWTAHPDVRGSSQLWKESTDAAMAKAKGSKEVADVLEQSALGISIVSAIRSETMPGPPNPLDYSDPDPPRRLKPVRLTPVRP